MKDRAWATNNTQDNNTINKNTNTQDQHRQNIANPHAKGYGKARIIAKLLPMRLHMHAHMNVHINLANCGAISLGPNSATRSTLGPNKNLITVATMSTIVAGTNADRTISGAIMGSMRATLCHSSNGMA